MTSLRSIPPRSSSPCPPSSPSLTSPRPLNFPEHASPPRLPPHPPPLRSATPHRDRLPALPALHALVPTNGLHAREEEPEEEEGRVGEAC